MSDLSIDSIQLEVASNSSDAEKSLDRLSASLLGLDKALGRVANNAGAFRKLASSLSSLSNIKLPDFRNTIDQLERISRIDLKNLNGKEIKLDIKVSGLSETERMKVAMEKTAADIRKITDGIANDIANAYNMKGEARKHIQDIFADMGRGIAKDSNGIGNVGSEIGEAIDLIAAKGKISFGVLKEEYQSFLDYMKQNKIKLSDGVDKPIFNQSTTRTERQDFFNQKNGVNITSIYDELVGMFPGIMSGLADIVTEEEQVYAVLEKIRQAKDTIQARPIDMFTGNELAGIKSGIYESVNDGYIKAVEGVQSNIASVMASSAKQIPLDLMIDQARFENQITKAVEHARQKDYGKIDVKLGVDTTTLRNEIISAFSGPELKNLQGVSEELIKIVGALSNLKGVDTKATGLNSFVNAIARLSASTGSIDNAKLTAFTNTIKSLSIDLSQVGQGTEGVTNLIKSITSFARAGEKMKTASENLPAFTSEMKTLFETMNNMQFSDNALRMAEALAQISRNSQRTGSSLRNMQKDMQASNGQLRIMSTLADAVKSSFKTLVNLFKSVGTGAVSAIGNLANKFRELTHTTKDVTTLHFSLKNLLATVIGFRGISGIFNWGKEAVKLGGDITEIDHIVESVFGSNMVGYVDTWASNAIDKFGIAAGAAKQYAGTLSAMFQASNVSMNNANKMAMDLTGLAGDLSAFFNIDTETAFNKIRSGMAGMVRPLRDLGIDLSVATLREYALSQGIEKSWASMTQAEKMMLRYKYIMEVTTTQSGDFSRTSASLANSLRTLQAYTKSVTTQIGVGFAAAIRPAIVWLNSLMKYVVKAAQAFATFMQTLFGKYKGGASGMAMDMSMMDADDYASDLADSAGDAASGIGDADEAAKKLKKDLSVLPFDELNQLNKDRESTSSGSGTGGTGGGVGGIGDSIGEGLLDWGIDEVEGKLGKLEDFVSKWAERIKAAFNAKDWQLLGSEIAWGINKGVDKLYEILNPQEAARRIFPYIDAVSGTLNSLVDSIHWNKLGRTVGEGVNIIVQSVNRLIDPATGINWTNIGRKFADGANGLVDEVDFAGVGDLFANKFNIFWEIASGFVTDFDWDDLGDQLANGANALVRKVDFHAVSTTFRRGINGITDAMREFLKDFGERDFGRTLASTLSGFITGVNWKNLGIMLTDIWNKAWSMLVSFVRNLGSGSNGLSLQDAIDEKLAIKNGRDFKGGQLIGTGIGDAIRDAIEGAIENINVTDMGTAIKTLVKKIADDITIIFGRRSTFEKLGEKIGTVISDILKDSSTWEKLSNAVNAVTSALVTMLGSAISELSKHKGQITQGITTFIRNLDWGGILTLAAPLIGLKLASALGGLTFSALHKTLESKMIGLFKSVGATESVVSSSGSLFGGLISALGTEALPGTVIGGLVIATDLLAKLSDLLKGGNGQLSLEGGATDSLTAELTALMQISPELEHELFLIKEDLENGTISSEDFGRKLSDAFTKAGVPAEYAKGVVGDLAQRLGGLNDNQIKMLLDSLSYMPTTAGQSTEALETMGITTEQAFGGISRAVSDCAANYGGAGLSIGQTLQQTLADHQRYGTDVGVALRGVVKDWEAQGYSVESLRSQIDKYLGEGTFDKLISESGTAKTNVESVSKAWETSKGKQISVLDSADKKIEASKQLSTNAMLEEKRALREWQSQSETSSTGARTAISTGITEINSQIGNADYSESIKKGVNDSIDKARPTVESTAYKLGSDGTVGLSDGLLDSIATSGLSKSAQELVKTHMLDVIKGANGLDEHSPSKKTYDIGVYGVEGLINGIRAKFANLRTASTETVNIVKGIITGVNNQHNNASTAGKTFSEKLIQGLKDGRNSFSASTFINDMFDGLDRTFRSLNTDFKTYGYNMMSSFQNGIYNFGNIKLPSISASWERYEYGDGGWFELPEFTLNWYRRGGLFTDPSIVGVGEAGDEAALPLENRRVMNRIANAIVENSSGGLGVSKQDIVDAVVYAMAANAQNQPPINVTATLYTEDNEVLARSVERGQQSRNMRFNPTAAY